MSEAIAAEILIGGPVPENLVEALCAEISAAGVSLDWGDASFEPNSADELLCRLVERDGERVLALCDYDARWGQFDDLEAFLTRHGIPFDRRSDGKYEYDPEWLSFRPGSEPRLLRTDHQHEPQVPMAALAPVLRDAKLALAAVERGRSPLKPLRRLEKKLAASTLSLPSKLPSFAIGPAQPTSDLIPEQP